MLAARPSPRSPGRRLSDRRGALLPARRVRVGRLQPNDELAALDRSIEQLRADLAAYSPPEGDVGAATAWASIVQTANLLSTRWNQWYRVELPEIWYWGDEDENVLTTFRNQYNALRERAIAETRARVTAPPAETPREIDPDYKPPPPPPTDLTVKELLLWITGLGLAGGIVYAVASYKLAPYLAAARRAAGAS